MWTTCSSVLSRVVVLWGRPERTAVSTCLLCLICGVRTTRFRNETKRQKSESKQKNSLGIEPETCFPLGIFTDGVPQSVAEIM